ncbi:acyltransferase family protein [Thiomicrorhabdus sediminis]|nr:acyltransferase [Thiomicrorhabdus sediminis]
MQAIDSSANKSIFILPFLWFFKALILPWTHAKEIIAQPNKAFIEVDFLKGLSVLMVITFHVFFAVFVVFKKQPEALQLFIDSIPPAMSFVLGFDKAVDIFFMLSSFLLTYSLLNIHEKKQDISVSRFYLHRFFRIYPLFVVALLLYGLADIDKLLRDGWYSLLFIENIFSKGIIPVQWSLSIEMQFYLIMPWLILLLLRSCHGIFWLVVLIVLSAGARYWVALSDALIYQTPWYQMFQSEHISLYMDSMYYVIETRLTPLLLGMLWAWLIFFKPNARLQSSAVVKALVWISMLSLIYISMRFPVYAESSHYYQVFDSQINLAAISLHRIVFSVAILVLILFGFYQLKPTASSVRQNLKQRLLENKTWRLLSEVAYPMYFFHFPFVAIAWVLVLGTTEIHSIEQIRLWMLAPVIALAIAMTLYFSLWMNFLIEARFIKIGKQIETKWFAGHNAPANRKN